LAGSPEIVVVGGGVIGLTIARGLRADGAAVTVLERDVCGRGASWAGAGVLAPPNPHRSDAVAELHLRSLAMFPALCAELLAETGVDPEYDPCGEIEVALDERGLQSLRSDARAARERSRPDGMPAFEVLATDEARRLEPSLAAKAVGAMLCRETAQVRNPRLLQALKASCMKRGVSILESEEVFDILVEGERFVGLQLSDQVVHAAKGILCAGAWSTQIGTRLAALMPVRPVRGQMICMKLDRPPLSRVVSRGKTYWVPRRDGHVLLGATEEHDAGFVIRNTPQGIGKLIAKGLELVPSLADAPIVHTWAGLRPGTPDDLPYLGPVPGFEGLIAATGHFRSGLGLAPATAEVVAAVLAGRALEADLSCARVGRLRREEGQCTSEVARCRG
jgi:glycine oxidase